MSTVSGVVKAKSANKYGFGVMVNDNWYNSKYEIKANKGDEVEFDDGGKNYCKGLKVIAANPSGGASSAAASSNAGTSSKFSRGRFPIPKDDGQRSIIRQNSLGHAIEALISVGVLQSTDPNDMVSTIISTARLFEAYSAGDLDSEAAKMISDGFDPTE